MGQKRPGFTLEKHFELGDELRDLERTMARIFFEIQDAYGKTSRQGVLMRRAWETMKNSRSALDDAACRENPIDNSVLRAYYGERRQPSPD